jgi:hypothetical protein
MPHNVPIIIWDPHVDVVATLHAIISPNKFDANWIWKDIFIEENLNVKKYGQEKWAKEMLQNYFFIVCLIQSAYFDTLV